MSRSSRALAALVTVLFISVLVFAAQGLYTAQRGKGSWPMKSLTAMAATGDLAPYSAASGGLYLVSKGDTLWNIARSYGITVSDLKNHNRLVDDLIVPGQPLRIPAPERQEDLSETDIFWLVRVISAESRGEPLLGQVAVGAVVLNRVRSEQFPNDIKGVVFQKNQFSVVDDGSIYRAPVSSAYTAARLALRGCDPTNGSLYFYNPRLVSSTNWIRSRTAVTTIGRHLFAN